MWISNLLPLNNLQLILNGLNLILEFSQNAIFPILHSNSNFYFIIKIYFSKKIYKKHLPLNILSQIINKNKLPPVDIFFIVKIKYSYNNWLIPKWEISKLLFPINRKALIRTIKPLIQTIKALTQIIMTSTINLLIKE